MKKLTITSIIPAFILTLISLTQVVYADLAPFPGHSYDPQPTCDNTDFILFVVAGNIIILTVFFGVFAIIRIRKQNRIKK